MGQVIKLGLPGALRDYSTEQQGDGIAWERGPANPFAARVNTTGEYDRVDIWNDWVQEDWQAGVGRVDPEEGGFLYAEAETRVPGQVILPPLMQQCDQRTVNGTTSDCRYMPSSVAGTILVGNGGYERMAVSFTLPNPTNFGSGTAFSMCVYAQIPVGVTATVAIYSNSAGAPNAVVVSGTMTGTAPDKLFEWYGLAVSNTSLVAGTQYWLVIYPTISTNTITVAYGSTGYDTASQVYTNAAWAALTGKYMLYTTDAFRIPNNLKDNSFYFRFNSVLYHTAEGYLYKYDSTNEQFDSVGTVTGTGNITSVAIYGPTVFFARSSGNYTTMNTSEAFSAAASAAALFLEWQGYLWRAYQNDVYYSTDGSTWSSAIQVGGDDSNIRGMAGMGDSLYLATDKALFRLAPGDVIEEVTRFGTEDSTNGLGMVEYQGALYIPAGGRLFRFDQSGQMMDVWVSRDDDLLTNRVGKISGLVRMNNWLVATVVPVTAGGRPTLWLWQEEGWHFVVSFVSLETVLIPGTELHSVYYDRNTSRLWFNYAGPFSLFIKISDYTINPFNSTTYLFQPFGWLEQDRFYGGQYLLNKSWESVTIVGDNLSSNVCVKVYFQDEDSTGWELLGTATEDGQELRWANYATRPSGKWVKIGLLLQTNSGTETPRVRAVAVKFYPRPNGRITDNLTLTLKDYVQMPDGDPSDYTVAQQQAHIESLIDSIDPVIYQDIFGKHYEVGITSWHFMVTRFEYYNGANVVSEMRVPLVLEQVPETTYPVGQPVGLLLALTYT